MMDHRLPGEGPLKPTHWTVQIMPDGGGRIRTKRITRRLVRGLTAAAALIALLLAGGLAVFGSNSVREAELARLRLENRHLTSNLSEVEAELAMIGAAIDELSDQDQRFRLLAGLPHIDPDVLEAGVGGPLLGDPAREEFLDTSPDLAGRTLAASYDVDRLLRRVDLLSASMDDALDSVALHEEFFLARPSIRPVQSSEA